VAQSRIPEISIDGAQKFLEKGFYATWLSAVLWRCHVERSETSLFIHAAAIDPKIIRASSLRSE